MYCMQCGKNLEGVKSESGICQECWDKNDNFQEDNSKQQTNEEYYYSGNKTADRIKDISIITIVLGLISSCICIFYSVCEEVGYLFILRIN